MKYGKPPTSLAEQIRLLDSRGMVIADPDAAGFYLSHIGYYRLRGYWIPFEEPVTDGTTHRFRRGTTFERVLNLYTFDRELRLLVNDAIERVEISVRNQWVDALAQKDGAHAYLKSSLFAGYRYYGKGLAEITREFEQSKEPYIRHYKKRYKEPDLPPLWVAVSIMTLGQFSHWFSNLKHTAVRTGIAKVYDLDEAVLSSFLHHLTVIRNLCAHHARLWNREVTVTMKLPRTKPASLVPNLDIGPDPNRAPRRIYNTLVMLAYLMDRISPGHRWKQRLFELLERHRIEARQMGFPADYRERPLWRV